MADWDDWSGVTGSSNVDDAKDDKNDLSKDESWGGGRAGGNSRGGGGGGGNSWGGGGRDGSSRGGGAGGDNSWGDGGCDGNSWGGGGRGGNSWGGGGRDGSSRGGGRGGEHSWRGGGRDGGSRGNNRGGGHSWGGGGRGGDSWGGGGRGGDSWGGADAGKDSWGGADAGKDSWGGADAGKDSWGGADEAKDSWGSGGGGRGRGFGRGRSNDAGDNHNERKGEENGNERPEPYRPQEIDLEEEAKLQEEAGENFKRYEEQSVTCFPGNLIKPITKFEDVIESKLLLKNVGELNYKGMTPIQKWAMPAIKEGYDIIGCAQTGSGKTAAFLLPILQSILKMDLQTHDPNENCQNPYCLIISPTRELARQLNTHVKLLSKDSLVKSCCIYGSIQTSHLKAQLQNGCHILVATLGRLKDFLERGWIGFKNIRYIVLDEGDRLIDEGFRGDITTIFGHETMTKKEERQTLFFSATFKKDIQAIARQHLRDVYIFLAVGKIGSSNEDIKQEFLQIERSKKKSTLMDILRELPESDKAIIFTQTKSTADFLAGLFTSSNLPSASIHGDRLQHQREQALDLFRRGLRRFLISSPVGNRGLDLPKVAVVINYEMPTCIDEYVHRIGRTGRAGHTGRAISFIDLSRDREILPDLIKNLNDAKQEIPEWLTEDGCAPSAADGGDFNNRSFKVSLGGEEQDWTNSAPAAEEDWGATVTGGGDAPSATAVADEDDWGLGPVESVNVEATDSTELHKDDKGVPFESTSGKKRPAEDDETENPPKKLDAGPSLPTSTDDAW